MPTTVDLTRVPFPWNGKPPPVSYTVRILVTSVSLNSKQLVCRVQVRQRDESDIRDSLPNSSEMAPPLADAACLIFERRGGTILKEKAADPHASRLLF